MALSSVDALRELVYIMLMSIYAAPAKINLSLRVLSKRPDGYHEVDLLMARLDLEDELEFTPAPELELVCNDPTLPVDENNLVLRAVREFEKAYGRRVHCRISLTKRIPHGAGLGGGSSDAAATLVALNEMLGTQYDREELAAMAAAIGSDVPFFINPVISRCTGRGEIVTPEPKLADWQSPVVILKPAFGVSTPDAYKRLHDARRVKGLPYGIQKVRGVGLMNDLERPVFAKFPVLGLLKSWLISKPGVRAAMMSGSGSALFALTDTPEQAQQIALQALDEFDPTLFTWQGTVNPAPALPDGESTEAPDESGACTLEPSAPECPRPADESARPADESAISAVSAVSDINENAENGATDEKGGASSPSNGSEPPAAEAGATSAEPAEAPDESAAEAPASDEKTPRPKRRGRKPEALRRALADAAAFDEEAAALRRELDADLAALHKAGIDPEVRRRGRRPVALSLYLEKQQKLAELEAKRDEAQALADQLERARS